MSTAPRPNSTPSAMSPANGACDHAFASPVGTTSVWPANIRCGAAGADAGVEVLDVGGARLGERHAVHGEARALQQRFEIGQRAAFHRGDRRAAQQVAGDGDGIGGAGHAAALSGLAPPRSILRSGRRLDRRRAWPGRPGRGRMDWRRWCRAGSPVRRTPRRAMAKPISASDIGDHRTSSGRPAMPATTEALGHDIEQHHVPAGLVAVVQPFDADREARNEHHHDHHARERSARPCFRSESRARGTRR